MASRNEIEKIDVEAAAESPATRSLLLMLKTMLLQVLTLLEDLRADLAKRDAELAELKQALYGQKSERQRPQRERKRPELSPEEATRRHEAAQKKRRASREKKAQLPTEEIEHDAVEHCPSCEGAGPFDELPSVVSFEYEVVPARVVRRKHIRHQKICPCGQIFCGPAPRRVGDCAHYGPGLHADAVVSKCADALPINRLAKRYQRAGVPMARSTLNDLFHRSATILEPIHKRLAELVAAAAYVNADETPQPVMDTDKCRRGYMWTFISRTIIVYAFSPSRSGETPCRLLGDSTGILQVDGYTGYNHVTTPNKRLRAGCIAHARRYFHKARSTCPDEADHIFELIRKLYRVEYEAAKRNIVGSGEHLALRRLKSKPLMDEWHSWAEKQQPLHLPKSPMGEALRYTLNQWKHLTAFLKDARISLDNNVSERALRIVALGRDNFRWVGNDTAGRNLAILQTVTATCIASGVNPQEYLTDVLVRLPDHPASALDELLPMNWSVSG